VLGNFLVALKSLTDADEEQDRRNQLGSNDQATESQESPDKDPGVRSCRSSCVYRRSCEQGNDCSGDSLFHDVLLFYGASLNQAF